jgi:hypothetical protein
MSQSTTEVQLVGLSTEWKRWEVRDDSQALVLSVSLNGGASENDREQ